MILPDIVYCVELLFDDKGSQILAFFSSKISGIATKTGKPFYFVRKSVRSSCDAKESVSL